MPSTLKVLVTSCDPETRWGVAKILGKSGIDLLFSSTVSEAKEILARQRICLVFSEAELPDGGFRDILSHVARSVAKVPVVVLSRLDEWDQYLEAMRLGAFDYVTRPYHPAEIEWIVSKALRMVPADAWVAA